MKSIFAKSPRGKRRSVIIASLVGVLILAAVSVIGYFVVADILENDTRVEPESELRYYLKVKYDGVDRAGVQSSDSTTANIKSGQIEVSDPLPDGLIFVGFETTSNGKIGAVERGNNSNVCSGHVIDDTNEASLTEGTWNAGNTEFTYHGLHYDAASRTVSFKVESMKAGCELTVGIITQTPALGTATRMDFYNTGNIKEGILNENSNTVHVWMGREGVDVYNVTYQYTGTVPDNAPDIATFGTRTYSAGTNVSVAMSPDVEGYTFSGWSSSTVTITNGQFTMPTTNVVLTGYFTAKPAATTYSVTYVIDGDDVPDGYMPPKTHSYEAGTIVTLDSTVEGDEIDDYVFNGWTSTDATLTETGFEMPAGNVTIHGTFTRKVYTVHYEFEGVILPPNSSNLLPADATYPAGQIVTRANDPNASGYRFLGWYKGETFEMPANDITIYGEWTRQAGVFAPTITKTITNPQTKYKFGETVYFNIVVTNTAAYPINTIQIVERLEGVEFVAGNGYNVAAPQIAIISSLNAGASITLQAKFEVQDVTQHYINTVELVGALAENDYSLDTSQDYIATVAFDTESWQDTPVLSGIFTNSTTLYIALMLCGAMGLLGAGVVINKTKQNKERRKE